MTQDAHTERREIEKQLMASAEELLGLYSNPAQWLDSQALKTFSKALYELVQFHQWHGEIRDTVVGFLGINAYIIVTGLLNEMLLDEKNSDLHEKMKGKLDYIKMTMQE